MENYSNENFTCLIFVQNTSIDESFEVYPKFFCSGSIKVVGIDSAKDNTLELKLMDLHWFEMFMLRFI